MIDNIIQSLIGGVPPETLVLVEIGIMMIVAAILAFLVRLFKQPLIPAYVVAGIILGPLMLGLVQNQELVLSLSEIGVAFLIFTAGLEINFSKIKQVGKSAAIGGIIQILLLIGISVISSIWLGISGRAPVYIGLIVAFSSTMVVIKLLYDRKELSSLHARIIIGILLIQDIAAIVALSILTTDLSFSSVIFSLGKAVGFAIAAMVLSKAINPVLRKSANNSELLLLTAISFLFLFAIGSILAELSVVIGAFFAGVALANSDYKVEIEGKIAPLRNFFAILFFIALGLQLRLIGSQFLILLGVLLLLVMIVKPLIIMYLVRISGYKKRTAFFSGNSLAQTSEFSLVIATLGFSLGHISQGLFSTLILLTVITMSLTTYLISYERRLYAWFSWPLNILNGLKTKNENLEYQIKDGKRAILFGCHRMGSLLLTEFEREKKGIMVVDYNPEIIKALIYKKIPCIYGDFINEEILEKIDIKNAEMLISTIPDLEDNLLLIKKAKHINKKVPIFVAADRISDALKLYESGADYVILAQVIGGQKTSGLIKEMKANKSKLKLLKENHINYLNSIHRILY